MIDTLSGGGAEQVMLRLAEKLMALGHSIIFCVIRPVVSYEIPHPIKPIFIYDSGVHKGIKYFYYRRTAHKLQNILDRLNAEQPIKAILSNLPETDRITRHIKGYRTFYCIHNSFYHSQISNKKNPIKRWLKKHQLRQIYNGKHLIFVSNGAKEDLEQNVGVITASSHVIYNPFPIKKIQKLAAAHAVDYQNYFLHIGRFNHQKRHDKLLKTYADSGLTNPLLLMGEGSIEQTNDIKQIIHQFGLEDKIIITGFKQNPYPYIRHANALLLTSDYEGLSNVLVEALICGTPVVSYDCPSGPKEILAGKLDEYLIPFNDLAAFSEKMRAIAANPRRIPTEMANLDRFEANHIAKQYLNVLDL